MFNPKRLGLVDETGTHTAFARLYARALRGERAFGDVSRTRGQTQTLIAALSFEGVVADVVMPGGTSGDVFIAFVTEVLVPNLRPDQVVVLGNLAARKGSEVRELIEGAGCGLVFLPSYSPDFNLIERLFSWLKAWLRLLGARTVGGCWRGLVKLIVLFRMFWRGAGFLGAAMTCDSQPGQKPL